MTKVSCGSVQRQNCERFVIGQKPMALTAMPCLLQGMLSQLISCHNKAS